MNGKSIKGRRIVVVIIFYIFMKTSLKDYEFGKPKAGFKYRADKETNTKYNTE